MNLLSSHVCGLEIVNRCIADSPPRGDIRLIALGPVAWRRPKAPHTLVQGRIDLISRAIFPSADVILPGVGHLNYLAQPSTLSLINKLLCNSISTSSAQGFIFPAGN